MNDKEKQIEEMALTLSEGGCGKECDCIQGDKFNCHLLYSASVLYNAGYRKQSENTVEVVRCKDCEYWTEVSFDAITEWHWGECRKPLGDYRDCDTAEHDFCSYAKMKGGAE